MRLSDRLLSFAPERHRKMFGRALALAGAAFVAFEIWRIALAVPVLLPYWRQSFTMLIALTDFPPLIAAVAITVAALAFAVPMLAFVYVLRWTHRRLFHRGTPR